MTDDREEQIAAWLDGAMPEDEARAFEAEMATDPELAARVRAWQANDAFIAAAFAPVAQEPIGQDMLDRLGLGAPIAQQSAPIAANDNPVWWRRYSLPIGGALAASLVAVLLLGPRTAPVAQDSFSMALDTTPAMQDAKLADGRVLQPTLTVRASNGDWCREYRLGGDVGLACRDGGRWKVEAQGAGGGPAQDSGIALAGGPDGAALDEAYRRIGASDPLAADAEAALIKGGWEAR